MFDERAATDAVGLLEVVDLGNANVFGTPVCDKYVCVVGFQKLRSSRLLPRQTGEVSACKIQQTPWS